MERPVNSVEEFEAVVQLAIGSSGSVQTMNGLGNSYLKGGWSSEWRLGVCAGQPLREQSRERVRGAACRSYSVGVPRTSLAITI